MRSFAAFASHDNRKTFANRIGSLASLRLRRITYTDSNSAMVQRMRILLLLSMGLLSAAAHPVAYAATFSDGELLFDQPGWDYSPSSLIDLDGKEKVWWCGHLNGHDVVKYRERTATGSWSAPVIVLQANQFLRGARPLTWEGVHTCDPTVTRGHWNYQGQDYGYVMYYTTERPGSNGIDNRIAVAFSNDGINWKKHDAPVIHDGDPGTYGTGQSVAWSADGASGIRTVYTYVDGNGDISYFYRESPDAINFGEKRKLSQNGLTLNGQSGISHAKPAIGFAPGTYNGHYFYYMASVCEAHLDSSYGPAYPEWGTAKGVCVYRAEGEDAFTGTWTKVLDSAHIKPVEVEPGFLTNIYGSLDGILPTISIRYGCSGSGDPNTWEICWSEGKLD
ncbi:hypothetical protein GGR71_000356 [Xanthomonas sp. F1]